MKQIAGNSGLFLLALFLFGAGVSGEPAAKDQKTARLVLALDGPVLERDRTPARKPLSLDNAMSRSMACIEP